MAQKARNPWLIALTSVLIIIYSHVARAQGERREFIRANITAQMVQDGIVAKTRLFVFEFYYSPKNKYGAELCEVRAITVNNILCDATKENLGFGRGVSVKAEFWTPDYVGRERMNCTTVPLDKDKRELIVNIDLLDAQFTHRLIVKKEITDRVVDYKGQLIKNSAITNRIELADYRPIRRDTWGGVGWADIELGCNRMFLPVIVE